MSKRATNTIRLVGPLAALLVGFVSVAAYRDALACDGAMNVMVDCDSSLSRKEKTCDCVGSICPEPIFVDPGEGVYIVNGRGCRAEHSRDCNMGYSLRTCQFEGMCPASECHGE